MYRKIGTLDIKLSKYHDTDSPVFGHVTFSMEGKITSDRCKWNFDGVVGANDDRFDFDFKKWGKRDWYKEIITRMFAITAGKYGTPYTFRFDGTRKVSDGGSW